MRLSELLSRVLVNSLENITEENLDMLDIKGVAQDTRKTKQGFLFVCIEGYTVDGHKFVKQAVEEGAIAIVAQKPIETDVPVIYVKDTNKALPQLAAAFYDYPSEDLKMYGVTGTNGKTTVTHMIEHILSEDGRKTGLIGTLYNRVGDRVIETVNTTPEAVTLQGLFAEMRDEGVRDCVMEVSSHALYEGRTWGVDFDVAVFTNLSQDHLDFHKTMDNYFLAKSLLFSQLGSSYAGKEKFAVINIDDEYGERLVPLTSATIVSYGCKGVGDVQAANIVTKVDGTHFDLLVNGASYPVRLPQIGHFNVYNVLAAVGATIVKGIAPETIVSALNTFTGVRGRMQLVPNVQEKTIIVDFAHTPDGLENVLDTLNKIKTGKIITVVGSGGDRDKTKRPKMAQAAAKLSDYVIFTSDNPRTEDPQAIIDDMVAGLAFDDFETEVDRRTAIQKALAAADENDIILIAGKGHETYQIIGTIKYDFDDVKVIEEFLAK
ncbi:UDP-N-acetylmuramoyl-L-alanyl-D-glutamate--2,6-diaminopimelate ligase [Enterococcus sp. HY326]|uniref:UDP-N-acetylmuramoyl-L-alanyl-D-glutamate--2, 6-diaminopimelate ligase n=1 Tax=Enterococcus sp. HY326 TaxID=2971265 RepID=UPI0022409528|nr:UDP-N-acetylmuramoyl-L-alanyl-D-glutamate--2,6-diaminopimelate ligase [Enterococcus sp. HY326]